MLPPNTFADPQIAAQHQRDLRAAAAAASFARVTTRPFAIDRLQIPATRRWALRILAEASRV